MSLRTLRILIVFALAIAAVAPALATPDIVPGQRIGKISLGMTADAVHKAMGQPVGTRSAAEGRGIPRDSWQASHDEWIFVYYKNGKVAQISTSVMKSTTARGIKTYDAIADVVKKYPGLKKSQVKLDEGTAFYYDDPKQGIAFETNVGEREDGKRVVGIIVHPPNAKLITF